jgi:hypothetical protein
MLKPNAETMASITPQSREEMLRLLQDTVPDLQVPQEGRSFSAMQMFIIQSLAAEGDS